MLISILTPYYYGKKFLPYLLESIRSQADVEFEHIIVNDGCHEDQEFLRSLVIEHRFKLIYQENRGQSAAVNRGFTESKGDLICWINQDDAFCENAFSRVMQLFEEDHSRDIVYGQGYLMDDKGEAFHHIKSQKFSYDDLLNKGNFIFQPSVFIRRKVLEEAGFLDENLHFAMDYDLWLRLGKRYKFYYFPVPLSYFRIHPTSKSQTSQIRFIPEILEIIRKNGGSLLSPLALRMYVFLLKEPVRWAMRKLGFGNALLMRSFLPRGEWKKLKSKQHE